MTEYVDRGMEEEEDDRGPTFLASFPGRCARCDMPFDEGDPVYFSDGQLIAEDGCD